MKLMKQAKRTRKTVNSTIHGSISTSPFISHYIFPLLYRIDFNHNTVKTSMLDLHQLQSLLFEY